MTSRHLRSSVSLALVLGIGSLIACGGGDDAAPATTPSGASGSTASGGSSSGGAAGKASGGTGSSGAAGSGTAGASGSGTAGSGTAGAAGSGTAGSGTGGCANPTVDVVYDLTGSTFEITDTPLGAGNQVNTVATPYEDPKHIGPGTMKLRFSAPAGQPDAGRVDVIDYDLVLEFTVSSAGASVHTDLVVDVTPPVCSGAQGSFASGKATWMPPGLDPYHTKGQVTCTGATCSLGGLPNGTPQPKESTEKLKLNDFVFTSGVTEFTMEKVQVSEDKQSKTWLTLKAKAVGAPTPSCGCK